MAMRGILGMQGYGKAGAIDISYEMVGLPQLERALAELGASAKQSLAAALVIEAEKIMTASKREVPVLTGALRSSGHVQPPQYDGSGGVYVEMGYGGPAVPYALKQHEDLTLNHDKRQKDGSVRASGKAKYLEDPFNRAKVGLDERLARGVHIAFERLRRWISH